MSNFIEEVQRRVVPRWRDLRTAVAMGELKPTTSSIDTAPEPPLDYLASKISAWRAHRAVPYAADLVSAAVVLGRTDEVRDAAAFLLDPDQEVTASTRRLAQSALGGPTESGQSVGAVAEQSERETRASVQRLRRALLEHPRNPLMWVDLARRYSTLGQSNRARDAMRRGVALAPDNRFALRSAARLHVHLGDPEEAARLLRSSSATRADPWLLAAEIAVATVMGRSSRLDSIGRSLLERKVFAPFQTTELASALGTVEMRDGSQGRARKLFATALQSPTDNTIAQAQWATRHLNAFHLDEKLLDTPRSFEARAQHAYDQKSWRVALAAAWEWLNDEPFSTQPAIFGSFVGSVLAEDFESTIRIARRGLAANPGDPVLLNNLAFALASSERVAEAQEVVDQLPVSKVSGSNRVAWLATRGLLMYRQGNQETGSASYRQAVEEARVLGGVQGRYYQAMAAAMWAREEISASASRGDEQLAIADEQSRGVNSVALGAVVGRIHLLREGIRLSLPDEDPRKGDLQP